MNGFMNAAVYSDNKTKTEFLIKTTTGYRLVKILRLMQVNTKNPFVGV